MRASKFAIVLVVVVTSIFLQAQGPSFPTVKYTQQLWSLNPPTYSLKVNMIGNAHYESTPNSTEQNGENYTTEFNISDATKNRIFTALEQLSFLQGTVDDVTPGDGGSRSLIYEYNETYRAANYHATSNPVAQKLTALFQAISETLETVRRLDKLHQQKDPALNSAVKRMLNRAQAGELAELAAAVPVLQSIANDNAVDATTRAQAQSVIKLAQSGASAGS